jgi:hypothetical protein
VRAVARGALALLLALELSGCATNIERSARLARQARRDHHGLLAQRGLTITHRSHYVRVLATTVLHDENGGAAVVTLRNTSSRPLREVPIEIMLHGTAGRVLYQNNTPGLGGALVSAPLLAPGRQFDWIDDQIPTSGTPGSLSVLVGEAPTTSVPLPSVVVTGVHLVHGSTNELGAEGTVVNHSSIAQQELVVFAVGRRAGRIVAAGRAVLPDVPARSSASFQVFFVGNPTGATLQVSAPPTTVN